MTNQPFFTLDRDAFTPTPAANGPWDPKSLHGRVIIGLLAFEIENRHGADDFAALAASKTAVEVDASVRAEWQSPACA